MGTGTVSADDEPVVQTGDVLSTDTTSVKLKGTIKNTSGYDELVFYFDYRKEGSNDEWDWAEIATVSSRETLTSEITDLAQNTTYEWFATVWHDEDNEVASGKMDTFTTGKSADGPPLDRYGQLQIIDTDLCDERGNPVQLTGMSTHGIQWYGNCITDEAMDVLTGDWKSDLMRIAMYTDHRSGGSGYIHDQSLADDVVDMVDMCKERGLYAVIDWHILNDGDPMEYVDEAENFFADMARRYADDDHVIYEICNEPNGSQFDSDELVDWDRIREYADRVIPAIRQHDKDGIIIIGTPCWSGFGFANFGTDEYNAILNNPYTDGENLMYTYHFYANTHGNWERDQIAAASNELPIFVTEWGSMNADGDGSNDFDSADAWVEMMGTNNISWANWNYSDDHLLSGVWESGRCRNNEWTYDHLTETGHWVRDHIRNS